MDARRARTGGAGARGLLAAVLLALAATGAQAQTPSVTVAATTTDGFIEGASFDMRFTSSAAAPSGGLLVNYEVWEVPVSTHPLPSDAPTPSFLHPQDKGRSSVRIAAGQTSATVTIRTVDDKVYETPFRVSVVAAVREGSGYTVAQELGTGSECPGAAQGTYCARKRGREFYTDLHIRPVKRQIEVSEGERRFEATFRLQGGNQPFPASFAVSVPISLVLTSGSGRAGEDDLAFEHTEVRFEPGRTETTLSGVVTDDDILEGSARSSLSGEAVNAEEAVLQIPATVEEYLEQEATAVRVFVIDDDTTALVVVPPAGRTHEGDAIDVTVRMAEGTRCEDIPAVQIPVTARAIFGTELSGGAAGAYKTVTLSDCEAEATVSFATTEDTADERHGFVRVEAAPERSATGHVVSNRLLRDRVASDTAYVRVYDDDGKGTFLYAGRFDATWVSATTDIDIVGSDAVEYQNGARSSLTLTTSDPPNGTATVTGNKLRYTPDTGFTGHDTFDYTVGDGTLSDTGRVRIEVGATTWSFSLPDSVTEGSAVTSTVTSAEETPSGEVRIVWHVLKSSTASAADITVKGCTLDKGADGSDLKYTCGQTIEPGHGSGNDAYPGEEAWVYMSRYSTDSTKNTGDTKLRVEANAGDDDDSDEQMQWVTFVNGRKAGTGTTAIATDPPTEMQVTVTVGEAPEVDGEPAISAAGDDGQWTPGEKVEVTVTFDEAVNVVTTGGTPSIGLTLGLDNEKKKSAAYASGSGTKALVFAYTLADADGSHASMMVPLDSLALNGGTIRSVASGADAALGHLGAIKVAVPPLEIGERSLAVDAEAFTARFANLPESHDGSGRFSFDVHFSKEAAFSWRLIAGGLLDIAGARIARVHRWNEGSDVDWTVWLEPTGDGDITIALPARACGTANAVCANGEPLAQAVSATVPGVPFTARFANLPANHDGSGRFSFDVHFSREVAFSWRLIAGGLLDIAGARIARVHRWNEDSNRDWTVWLEPTGYGDITIALPARACGTANAVCAGGEPLAQAVSATVAGPATLSVADAAVDEAEGATLGFVVTLSKTRTHTTTVDYATSDGGGSNGASAGTDYTATSGRLTFAAGETRKTVSVPVLDDSHDEGAETLTLTLSSPSPSSVKLADATATGTIRNTDHMPQAWLGRFGRTVAGQALEAVQARFDGPRTPGLEGRIAGQSIGGPGEPAPEDGTAFGAERDARAGLEALAGWLGGAAGEEEASSLRSRTLTGREVLAGTSFAFTGGAADGRGGAGFWGRGAVTRFDGRAGELTLDGEVASALLGADVSGERVLGGVMLSHSRGTGAYHAPAGGGAVESTLTTLFPYAQLGVSERMSLWGMAGYGAGTLTLTPEGRASMRPDLDLLMGAAGVRGVLVEGGAEGVTVAAKSDAFAVRTSTGAVDGLAASQADVTRVRLALEGSRAVALAGDAVLTPSLELGVRHDGGDAETGFGADLGAGLTLLAPARGLSAELRARALLTHEADGLAERGLSGSLAFDPTPDSERGLTLTLVQTVGAQASGGADALLSQRHLGGLAANDGQGERLEPRRFEGRLGYGFALLGERWTGTPEVGFSLSESRRETVLGWRLSEERRAGLVFGLGLEGARSEAVGGDAEPSHRLGFTLGWRLEGASPVTLELGFEGERHIAANDDGGPGDRLGFKATARW